MPLWALLWTLGGGLLPGGAVVVETKGLPPSLRADRVLVLWVLAPRRECPAGWQETWTPTCPESTRGCFMRGPTRLSLVDTRAGRIVQTLRITDDDADSFDVPYRLGRGGPYRVNGRFGRPSILRLADYTGDGVAGELALFDALSCSTLLTTLVGYNGHDD